MNAEEFKNVLVSINTELNTKDRSKALSDTFKVSYAFDEIDETKLTKEKCINYKKDFMGEKIRVVFPMIRVQNVVKEKYKVTKEQFKEFLSVVASENLYRAYTEWLRNEAIELKAKLL